MTIALQINRTYRTRDGSAEHKIDNIDRAGVAASRSYRFYWNAATGRTDPSREGPLDLVEEVLTAQSPQPNSPVRQRTTTVTEIVPGYYDLAWVGERIGDTLAFGVSSRSCTADELDALAHTATQLAAALRLIAAEQSQL